MTEQDRTIYEAGLIGSLREIQVDLDRAVFDAYDWPYDLTTDRILARVVALNAERRAEVASGLVRWLRPAYQAPNAVAVIAPLAGLVDAEAPIATHSKRAWPAALPDQVRAVRHALRANGQQNPAQIAAGFRPASRTRVTGILETLVALGQVRNDGNPYSL